MDDLFGKNEARVAMFGAFCFLVFAVVTLYFTHMEIMAGRELHTWQEQAVGLGYGEWYDSDGEKKFAWKVEVIGND